MMVGRTALAVLQDVCDRLGWSQIQTVENEDTLTKDDRKLVRALNRVLRAMSSIDDWPGLRKQGEIETIREYKQGVARTFSGLTTVQGFDDPGTAISDAPVWGGAQGNFAGRAFIVDGEPLIYRIVEAPTLTTLVLDRPYKGITTDGSASLPDRHYHIVQDRYDLPADFDRAVDDRWTGYGTLNDTDGSTKNWTLTITDANTVRERRRNRRPDATEQQPDVVTLWRNDEQNEHRQVIVDPFPRDRVVIQFDYQAVHPKIERDVQRILFPPRHEEMVQAAMEWLLLSGPDDDARAGVALAEFLRARGEDMAKQEIGQQRTRLTASQDRVLHQRSKWGRRGQRVNWGSFFDRKDAYDLP